MLIKPLTIGELTLPTNLIQGPLAGFTCSAYRELVWDYGDVAYCTTEMLSAADLIQNKQQRKRYVHRANNEAVLAYQLAGNKAEVLSLAAKIAVEEYGADIVDLNCGCPKQKIRKKGYGSKLLEMPENLIACLTAMRKAITCPLTVKIRLTENLENNITLVQQLASVGVDAISVHARTWQDHYGIACDWSSLAECVKAVDIPLIANGDIHSYNDLETIYEQTHAAGFMIARATTGAPWLFKQLTHQQTNIKPSSKRIGQLLLEHVDKLILLSNERSAILQTRKLARYYAKQIGCHKAINEQLNTIENYNDLKHLVVKFFDETVIID